MTPRWTLWTLNPLRPLGSRGSLCPGITLVTFGFGRTRTASVPFFALGSRSSGRTRITFITLVPFFARWTRRSRRALDTLLTPSAPLTLLTLGTLLTLTSLLALFNHWGRNSGRPATDIGYVLTQGLDIGLGLALMVVELFLEAAIGSK